MWFRFCGYIRIRQKKNYKSYTYIKLTKNRDLGRVDCMLSTDPAVSIGTLESFLQFLRRRIETRYPANINYPPTAPLKKYIELRIKLKERQNKYSYLNDNISFEGL